MKSKKKIQKVGILGGTFDPVHDGHLAVAGKVLDRYELDQIIFIPAFSPPHKTTTLTPFSHRVAMLEAALAQNDIMSVSILEAERNAPSYTVETLLELHKRMGSSKFYLIMGGDMFVEIELWYRYNELFELADIIVAARPGISVDSIADQVDALNGTFTHDPDQQMWCRKDGFRIFYYGDISESISSSEIRTLLVRGESVSDFVAPAVREYIHQHQLYTS